MHKRAFQALKHAFLPVSVSPQPYFDERNQIFISLFFINI